MYEIKNMTKGNTNRIILGFFFPMLFTNVLQQAYTFADTVIVGRGLGDNALAAVGNASAVSLFILGFLTGLTGGFSIIISQHYGAGNYSKMRRSIALSLKVCCMVSIILTAVSLVFMRKIMITMRTDAVILNDSLLYSCIISGGLTVTAAYNLFSGILRALGDSKTPFAAIVISSAVNIILDIIFIFILRTGVWGAAAATVFSQLVSVFICLIKFRKTEILNLKKTDFKNDKDMYYLLIENGLPMAFMNSLTAAGCIIVQSFINTLGADGTSAYSVCTRYLNLLMLPSVTAGLTISAFAGQNYGAGKYGRIRQGVRMGLIIAVISFVLSCVPLLFFPGQLAELMLSGETAVTYASYYLKILGITLIELNCIFIFRSAVQGMGKPVIPMLSGIAEMVLRIAVIVVFLRRTGYTAAAYADMTAWTGALILNAAAYWKLVHTDIG